ncbi:hypothetical protein BGX23_006095 [Mortierella sp. AD031]|nr:hypothetical protein BGX23_006095 [Mortierella sp. AD031]
MAFEQDLEYLDGNESMGEYIERMNGRKCKMEEPLDDDLDHGPEYADLYLNCDFGADEQTDHQDNQSDQ